MNVSNMCKSVPQHGITQRMGFLDSIAGIGMVWVIFIDHTMQACQVYQPHWLLYGLSFVMPWFFFKSGMFYRSDKTYGEQIRNNIRRLLVPFAVWYMLGIMVTKELVVYIFSKRALSNYQCISLLYQG